MKRYRGSTTPAHAGWGYRCAHTTHEQ